MEFDRQCTHIYTLESRSLTKYCVIDIDVID